MNLKKLIIDFVITFVVTLIVTAGVTYLWNLIFHRICSVEWETSFRFAIILGIIITWLKARESKDRKE